MRRYAGLAVTRPAAAGGFTESWPCRVDHRAWVEFLRGRVTAQWRTGEFDPDTWLFTGDPSNPMTTSTTCKVRRCDTVVSSRMLCTRCNNALTRSGRDEERFLDSYRPPARQHLPATGERCVINPNPGGQCQRRRMSSRSGLCEGHGSDWSRYRSAGGKLTRAQWGEQVARPLPARKECLVSGCPSDGKLDDGLCGLHFRQWRRDQIGVRPRQRPTPARWAALQLPRRLQVHQFSLALVGPTVRWELLYALQQRDALGFKLDPVAVRKLATAVADLDALAITADQVVVDRARVAANARAYARLLTRIIHLGFEQFRGIVHTDKDVWDSLALDLDAPRPEQRRPNLAIVDFTPITQRWLREATKEWVRTYRPDSGQLGRTLSVCTVASAVLAQRPGGGHQPNELTFADMTAVFLAVKTTRNAPGSSTTPATAGACGHDFTR
jgi:hypothetical protein